jgi:hypothetical protein
METPKMKQLRSDMGDITTPSNDTLQDNSPLETEND